MDKLTHHGQMIAIFNYFLSSFLNNIVQLQLSVAWCPVRHLSSRTEKKNLYDAFLVIKKHINMKVVVPLKLK